MSKPHSTLTTNAVWKKLDDAVERGDGGFAEEIVHQVMKDYENQFKNVSSENGTVQKEPLDSRMFSMVLQAWKNGESTTYKSALRAHKLLELMSILSQEGVITTKPSFSDYLTVLQRWRQASASDSNAVASVLKNAEEIWSLMQDAFPDEYEAEFYQVIIDILANAGEGESAEKFLEAYKQRRLRSIAPKNSDQVMVKPELCLAVLNAHIHSFEVKSLERAEEFLRRMHSDECLPSPTLDPYNLVLKGWVAPSKHRDTVYASNRVEALLTEMKRVRVQPNTQSYQYGLEALARLGEGARAEMLLTNLLKEYTNQFDAELKPSVEPFRTVLWAYYNSHDPDAAFQAESVLKNMMELSESDFDTQPTTWDYNLVLKCWSRSRSSVAVERAMKLYGEMVSRSSSTKAATDAKDTSVSEVSLKPDITSLNTLLNVSGKHEQAFETERLLWKFFDRHFKDPLRNPCPDKISFSTVMMAWSKSRDHDAPDRAEKLLRQLENLYSEGNEKCKPDLYCFSLLMSCWTKSRDRRKEAPWRVESILRRLQAMAKNGDTSMTPDIACWNAAIVAWTGDGHRAEAIFNELIKTRLDDSNTAVGPNHITLSTVMNAWAKTRSRESSIRAVNMLRRLEQLHRDRVIEVGPNVFSYSSALESLSNDRCVSSAVKAEELLNEMKASNDPSVQPNLVSYNCVIKAWSYASHPDALGRANKLLQDVIIMSKTNLNMKPNARTFGSVLKCIIESNEPDKRARVQSIVQIMKKLDCQQDKWIRNVLKDYLAPQDRDHARSAMLV